MDVTKKTAAYGKNEAGQAYCTILRAFNLYAGMFLFY